MRKVIVLMLLIGCGFGLVAQVEVPLIDRVYAISKIESADERLASFDSLTEELFAGLSIEDETSVHTGKWYVSEKTDPFDDSKIVTFMLQADSGGNYLNKKPIIIIRCKPGDTEFYISWDDYLGREVYVTHRIDQNEVEYSEWIISTDSQASFYPNDCTSFVGLLCLADKFVASVTPYNDNPIVATFDIRGLAAIAAPYRDMIEWLPSSDDFIE